MEIKQLKPGDVSEFNHLLEIFKTVFDNDAPIPGDAYLAKLLSHPDFMVFVVCVNHQVVGGLTLYVLHGYFSEKPTAYFYDVGITPERQGQGLGKALISEVCRMCAAYGFEEAYVEAESEDTDAVRFYRQTRFDQELNAVHFTYTLGA